MYLVVVDPKFRPLGSLPKPVLTCDVRPVYSGRKGPVAVSHRLHVFSPENRNAYQAAITQLGPSHLYVGEAEAELIDKAISTTFSLTMNDVIGIARDVATVKVEEEKKAEVAPSPTLFSVAPVEDDEDEVEADEDE